MESGGGFIPGCSGCGNLSYNSVWYEAFGVFICESCKKYEQLISKGQAKQIFLLTENDLKRLGALSKSNPQHKSWRPMQLYLQSQVEEIAHRKYGSVEALEERRQAKLDARLDSRLNKKKDLDSCDRDFEDEKDATSTEDVRPSGPMSKMERQVRYRLELEYSSRIERRQDTADLKSTGEESRQDEPECEEI